MQKFTPADVKPFEFSDLKGEHVVGQSKFQGFQFKDIEGTPFNSERVTEETIRQERSFEQKNDFKIDDTVRKFRGLNRQEQNDVEHRIQQEVERRLKSSFEAAYAEGLEKGRAEGKDEAIRSFQESADQKLEELSSVVGLVQTRSEELLAQGRNEIYEFIKRFTKWIILKEVNERTYLENLLEKLILELNARRNLIIKVGQANFAEMPEVVAAVEKKLGQLTNVRIEIVPELQRPGIVLEAENGLIDGSLEGVFENIDKIFDQVMIHEE